MLALKKKREAEKKAAAEAAAESSTTTVETPAPSSTGKVSLLGIGGKKTAKNNGESSNAASLAKKRTPGEIRIQKGTGVFWCFYEHVITLCLSKVTTTAAPRWEVEDTERNACFFFGTVASAA